MQGKPWLWNRAGPSGTPPTRKKARTATKVYSSKSRRDQRETETFFKTCFEHKREFRNRSKRGCFFFFSTTIILPVDISDSLSSLIGNEWNESLTDIITKKCSSLFEDALSDQQGDDQWRRSMASVMAIRSIKAAIKNINS